MIRVPAVAGWLSGMWPCCVIMYDTPLPHHTHILAAVVIMCCTPAQTASVERTTQLEAVRAEADAQVASARDAAAAATAALEEARSASAADAQRVASDKAELDKQLRVAQVRWDDVV